MLVRRVLGLLIVLQLLVTVSSHSAMGSSELSALWGANVYQPFQSKRPRLKTKEPQSWPSAFLQQAVRERFQIPASWQRHLDGVRGEPIVYQLLVVNALINDTPYVRDTNDEWKLPNEFLSNGGDCEDFAIAKYVLLRAMGYATETLRIAIVKAWGKRTPHALLVVKGGPGRFETYVLDNNDRGYVRTAIYVKKYRPLISFNEDGVWTHFEKPSIGGRILKNILNRAALGHRLIKSEPYSQ